MSRKHNDPIDPIDSSGKKLSWAKILGARENEELQHRGWKEYRPNNIDGARGCRKCGRLPAALAWVYFATGQEGWIVACMHCREQTDFLPTPIS